MLTPVDKVRRTGHAPALKPPAPVPRGRISTLMLPPRTKKLSLALLAFAACSFGLDWNAAAGDAYKWSVQYLIDNSRTVFGRPQKVSPRHNRGLAISPDGKYLYAGYHHSF